MKTRIFLSAFLMLLLEASAAAAGNKALFPSRRRGDFLGFNLPRMGNKWPYLKGAGWLSLQMPVKYTAYPTFGHLVGMRPLQLSFDYSFEDHFSIGAYLGHFQADILDSYGTEPYRCSFRSNSGGIRLTLHFSDLLNSFTGSRINVRKWDLYSTAHMGWYTMSWNVGEKYRGNRDFSLGSHSGPGIVMGLKYHPIPRLGLFAEGGFGPVSLFSFGISGKVLK